MGFGLMGLSSAYGAVEPTEKRLKVLDRAYELGERFWDSADVYRDSEDLVGEWFKRTGKRGDVGSSPCPKPSAKKALEKRRPQRDGILSTLFIEKQG